MRNFNQRHIVLLDDGFFAIHIKRRVFEHFDRTTAKFFYDNTHLREDLVNCLIFTMRFRCMQINKAIYNWMFQLSVTILSFINIKCGWISATIFSMNEQIQYHFSNDSVM